MVESARTKYSRTISAGSARLIVSCVSQKTQARVFFDLFFPVRFVICG